jgi:hypothetical protein
VFSTTAASVLSARSCSSAAEVNPLIANAPPAPIADSASPALRTLSWNFLRALSALEASAPIVIWTLFAIGNVPQLTEHLVRVKHPLSIFFHQRRWQATVPLAQRVNQLCLAQLPRGDDDAAS